MSSATVDTRNPFPSHVANWQSPIFGELAAETHRKLGEEIILNDTSFTRKNLPVTLILGEAIEEASCHDWDGYMANPADQKSIANALKFIPQLPEQYPSPDVEVDPQGDICFEWYMKRGSVFSICVGSNETVYYSGIMDGLKTHGTTSLTDGFPSIFSEFLKRVYKYV